MKRKILAFLLTATALTASTAFAKDNAPMIENGKKVKLHFTLKADGQVMDSSAGKEPMELVMGKEPLMPGLEKGLAGMKAGEKKSMHIKPEDGFGPVDPKAVVEIPKTKFPPEQELKAGMVFSSTGPNGQPVHGTIQKVMADSVMMDFNHPLAGKTIDMDIEILEIA